VFFVAISSMNVLVTAGNTQVPIDRVRCITNIFTGRTGARIALHAHSRGHDVTLLTSHPGVVDDLRGAAPPLPERWRVQPYRTFDDLQRLLAAAVRGGGFDAVVHSAAVSDYRPVGIYRPADNTRFRAEDARWESADAGPPALVDQAAGKVKSDAAELWLRLVRAPKLIDCVRRDWGFAGILVKFKLEVDVSEDRLLEIAEQSRRHSEADLMVANTLEGAAAWAYVGPSAGGYERVGRRELDTRLLDAVERLQQERAHG
jgi:phosphopantothenate-cysteine ligase/phosphopantothenoylcysteine decarboxylase/phosphopantothenate--cysteine ligase